MDLRGPCGVSIVAAYLRAQPDATVGRPAARGELPIVVPGGVAGGVEAPCCVPEVFEHVHEVHDDRDLDLVCFRAGFESLDLVVVAVHERDLSALVFGVASVGLVEDLFLRSVVCGE